MAVAIALNWNNSNLEPNSVRVSKLASDTSPIKMSYTKYKTNPNLKFQIQNEFHLDFIQ